MESSNLLEYGRADWVILPATMSLYGKRVVDIITAASTWDEETILVCEKQENDGRVRLAFVGTSGGPEGYSSKIGQSFSAQHDQTGQSKGMYKLVNVVHVVKGEIVSKVNEIGINKKASFAVFK
jgi:hypothetical protein